MTCQSASVCANSFSGKNRVLSFRTGNPAKGKLISGFIGPVVLKVNFDHFFTGDRVVELIFEGSKNRPGPGIDHFTTGGVDVFTIHAHAYPPGHILHRYGC